MKLVVGGSPTTLIQHISGSCLNKGKRKVQSPMSGNDEDQSSTSPLQETATTHESCGGPKARGKRPGANDMGPSNGRGVCGLLHHCLKGVKRAGPPTRRPYCDLPLFLLHLEPNKDVAYPVIADLIAKTLQFLYCGQVHDESFPSIPRMYCTYGILRNGPIAGHCDVTGSFLAGLTIPRPTGCGTQPLWRCPRVWTTTTRKTSDKSIGYWSWGL